MRISTAMKKWNIEKLQDIISATILNTLHKNSMIWNFKNIYNTKADYLYSKWVKFETVFRMLL